MSDTKYKLVDNKIIKIRNVCVHEFTVGDVEDPILLAGEPLWQWQQSEEGAWIMAHAEETPQWTTFTDYASYGTRFKIIAKMSSQNETFWKLKWGK